MIIGMEFRDNGFSNLDFSHIEKGNPGCGGTQYEFALLAHHLLKTMPNAEIVFFHFNENVFESGIREIRISNLQEIPEKAKAACVDILIFWSTHNREWYNRLADCQIKSIAWSHNFLNYQEIQSLYRSALVTQVVSVSREQYELLRGEDFFEKCTYIYNMIDFVPDNALPLSNKSNDVCILGSLIKAKGFHLLAKRWKGIVKKVPDAKLYVIGGGNLWNKEKKLGSHGLADQKYEDSFLRYLTDKNGDLLPSVFFLGNLGKEKDEIIKKCKVGVVNPTGVETFCLSAVEMQSLGVPVCTKRKNGLVNSIINRHTGLLSLTSIGLANNIVKLLKNDELNYNMGLAGIEFAKSFSGDLIVYDWIEQIRLANDGLCSCEKKREQGPYKIKRFRGAIHFLRTKIGLLFIPSPYQVRLFVSWIEVIGARIKNSVFH